MGMASAVIWLTQAVPGAARDDLPQVIALFALAGLGLGLGLPLALAGIRAWNGRPARQPGGLPIWVWLPATLSVVGLGAAVIAAGSNLAAALPPLHLLAIALPALGAVSLAARRLRQSGISSRQALGHVASGAFLAPALALLAELVVGLVVGAAAVLIIVLFIPGGADQVSRALDLLRPLAEGRNPDMQEALRLALWPPFALLALVLVSGLFPLLEEAIKPISAFLLLRNTPTAGAAFLSGVAAGAGFGLSEGLLNGAGSLDEWAAAALLRAGGTAMHAFASGLVAWGWYRAWRRRRPWPGLLAYGVAVALHATWNVLALAGGASQLFITTNASSPAAQLVARLVTLVFFGLLVILALVAYVGIALISRRLEAQSPPS